MKWNRLPLLMKIIENLLYISIIVLLTFYFYEENKYDVNYIIIIVLSFLVCLINLFCIKSEETPCNATL